MFDEFKQFLPPQLIEESYAILEKSGSEWINAKTLDEVYIAFKRHVDAYILINDGKFDRISYIGQLKAALSNIEELLKDPYSAKRQYDASDYESIMSFFRSLDGFEGNTGVFETIAKILHLEANKVKFSDKLLKNFLQSVESLEELFEAFDHVPDRQMIKEFGCSRHVMKERINKVVAQNDYARQVSVYQEVMVDIESIPEVFGLRGKVEELMRQENH